MRKLSRSALVSYSQEQMFRLVGDVESYPEFLPWCTNVLVHHRDEQQVEATLEMQRGGLRRSFTTRNRLTPFAAMDLSLVDGPFRHLSAQWTFAPLGDAGCKVTFTIEFEFANRVTDLVFASFFEESCNSLVDAFTQRAAAVYQQAG